MMTLPKEVQDFGIISDIVLSPHFEVKSNCILLSICDIRSDEVTENLHILIHQRQTHSQSWLADIDFCNDDSSGNLVTGFSDIGNVF